ncbi:MAG: FHA domain-containing protein, partial [Planctomycetota bacterium]
MIRLCVTTAAGRSTFVTDRNEVLLGSREGAMLRADGGALMLVDLGSPAGVSFAGQPVRQARLQPGSAFRIGDVLVEVEAVGAPPVPPKQKLQLAPAPPAPPAELVAHGPQADFGRELKKKLATTPWYAISAAVHALILLVMSLIPYERIEKYSLQQIKAELAEEGNELDEQPDDLEPDIESLHEDEPEDDFEELLAPEKKEKKDDSIPM